MSAIIGLGKQRMAAWINLVAYSIFGLSTAYLLCFVAKLELVGIWIGIDVGPTVVAVCYFVLIIKIDWF